MAHALAAAELNQNPDEALDVRDPENVAVLTERPVIGARSVYVDRSADGYDVEERLDVLVPQSYAAVTDRSANGRWIVRAVKCVAIAQIEAESAEDAFVLTLPRAVRRDDDVPIGYDLLAFRRLERLCAAIGRSFHDVGSVDRDLATIGEGYVLPAIQVDQAEAALLRLLDEVPIRGDPFRLLLLGFHDEPPAWCLEAPVTATAALLEDLATAGSDLRREQGRVSEFVPQPVVGD